MKTPFLFKPIMLLLLAAINGTAQESSPLPVTVTPADPLVRFTGRFDTKTPDAPRFSWPGSAISCRFTGSSINAVFSGDKNRFEIIINGERRGVLALRNGRGVYRIAENLAPDQPHTVELFHRTETLFGTAQFFGFQIEGDAKLSELPPRPQRRIEFVGDSITCGYGNEAASEKERFSPETENHYLSYASITARSLGAEHVTTAWTGGWLSNKAPEGRMIVPQIHKRTLADRPKSVWDFSKWIPQAVVVNLGTNDFSGTAPDESDWIAQYRAFLEELRGHYPEATLFLCTGPMLGGSQLAAMRRAVRAVADAERAEGRRVHYVEFPAQKFEDGLGADYHPSLKTHQRMADQLAATIRKEMVW